MEKEMEMEEKYIKILWNKWQKEMVYLRYKSPLEASLNQNIEGNGVSKV